MLVAVPTLPRRLDFGQGVPPSAVHICLKAPLGKHKIGCI